MTCVRSVSLVRWIVPLTSPPKFRLPLHFHHVQNPTKFFSSSATEDPLAGVRVLDLTRIVAGPYCTMVLGDLGAEVFKVEKPNEGDECRKWGPPFIGNSTESCYFVAVNRNKKSICVDMKSKEGKEILFELAQRCDVLVENYVPGKMDEMGLGYSNFKSVAPHLIYCSITGFGSSGPYSKRPGYDVIAASMGGLLHITGPANGEPCKVGVALTDIMTGLYAHGAIMAALIQRSKTGMGQKIDANLLSTQIASLINIGSNFLNGGVEAQRHGTSHPSIVPYEALLTKDECYITVGTGSDKQFVDLCHRFELPGLAKDSRFISNKLRVENRKVLLDILKGKFCTKTRDQWLKLLDGASFPYGPVNKISDVFKDPHILATDSVQTVAHPIAGEVKLVAPAVQFSQARNRIRLPPPTLGQHTEEILMDILQYSSGKIQHLKTIGAVA
ncbi:Succinate--hydroxymethylglutarate CoA-transferase [Frankliniella fusca]|uniref:Succinate--hydroxymethylglutarate CoA-transferase n=1 Tax=Frankliniella fusca TaxID=407009 RepID=A0AAE1LDS3_9NEOP|nr:Succinate--hydroxymethylglutarate CoA-transferase [Frankliniella fusca]